MNIRELESFSSKRELAERLNCSESTIDNRLDPNSKYFDERMPRPLRFGTLSRFVNAEIAAYIEQLVNERDQGLQDTLRQPRGKVPELFVTSNAQHASTSPQPSGRSK